MVVVLAIVLLETPEISLALHTMLHLQRYAPGQKTYNENETCFNEKLEEP